ncbi:MAG TPA: hypothetical protein VL282_19320, partial [Tepidisphaeraceae bacterium]|nr:hypothetical protein [Tepidisphaeraceae bacterium]
MSFEGTQPYLPANLPYVTPRLESFWRWSPDGRAIEWLDGRTIAFREEVMTVLRRLAPAGLPPFGAIVLLLAATRDNWSAVADKTAPILGPYRFSDAKTSGQRLFGVIPHRAQQELAEVLSDLEAVASLPPEIRQSTAAKAAMAEMVFDGVASQMDPASAGELIAAMDGGVDPELLGAPALHDEKVQHLAEELDALRAGLGRIAADSLKLFMAAGIDRTVEPAEIEIPAVERVRGLLKDLQNDPQLAGLAKLARDLLAAIHIPRVLVAPEDLPVGGVSDISNRGSLDRLLISELAHEEMTLAVRIALGEALYLHRESPAQHPPFGRAILIDAGIRMWGVPRIYASAVAMALLASSDERGAVQVHRSRSSLIEHADLTTKEGLTRHLGALDTAPQPGLSLASFVEAADRMEDQQVDLFIITHEDVLSDPMFVRHLRADPSCEWHVATVGRDGGFTLWLIGPAGRRELCRASL